MIFVTVGTSSWDFTRLVKEMDRIAGEIDEEVVIQLSDIEYEPQNAKYFRFTSKEEIEGLYETARVVVSHAGVGSIISTLKHSKPGIVVPRRKEYGELVDDHQVEIARELEKERRIKVVWNMEDLEETLKNIDTSFQLQRSDNRLNIVLKLRDYLHKYEGK